MKCCRCCWTPASPRRRAPQGRRRHQRPGGPGGPRAGGAARQGLPRERFDGMGQIFRKEGLVSSPLEERARYIYALSQELANTLSQMDGVITARVHVVLPERGGVGEEATPSTAAVFIKTQPGYALDALLPQIRRLVIHAIRVERGQGVRGLDQQPAARAQAPTALATGSQRLAALWSAPLVRGRRATAGAARGGRLVRMASRAEGAARPADPASASNRPGPNRMGPWHERRSQAGRPDAEVLPASQRDPASVATTRLRRRANLVVLQSHPAARAALHRHWSRQILMGLGPAAALSGDVNRRELAVALLPTASLDGLARCAPGPCCAARGCVAASWARKATALREAFGAEVLAFVREAEALHPGLPDSRDWSLDEVLRAACELGRRTVLASLKGAGPAILRRVELKMPRVSKAKRRCRPRPRWNWNCASSRKWTQNGFHHSRRSVDAAPAGRFRRARRAHPARVRVRGAGRRAGADRGGGAAGGRHRGRRARAYEAERERGYADGRDQASSRPPSTCWRRPAGRWSISPAWSRRSSTS